MPDWLQTSFEDDKALTLKLLIIRMLVAFALGCVVAGIYHLTHRRTKDNGMSMLATMVLLTVLIAMVTLVIGNSVARAFSLVGALAIVRFRTVVEDTRDTAFVIFAVAVGMAVGAGSLLVPLVGIPVAAVAAFVFRPRDAAPSAVPSDYTLTVRTGLGRDPGEMLRDLLDRHLSRCQLVSISTARQGAALELNYSVRLRNPGGVIALVTELNAVEGVQAVEIR